MFHDLIKLCKCLHNRIRSELEPKGIHRGQGGVLYILTKHDNVSQVDIARFLTLQRATVTRMLQRMERDGLIERYKDSDDERIIRVRLTEAGHKAESMAAKTREDINALIDTVLNVEEQEMFHSFLSRVANALNSGTTHNTNVKSV